MMHQNSIWRNIMRNFENWAKIGGDDEKYLFFDVCCISSLEMMHQNSIWRMSSFFFAPRLFEKTGRAVLNLI